MIGIEGFQCGGRRDDLGAGNHIVAIGIERDREAALRAAAFELAMLRRHRN